MKKFDSMMQEYTVDHEMIKKMINKQDKLLLIKANKNQVVELEIHTRQHFVPKH